MEIKLTAFGIAKDIINNRDILFNIKEGDTIHNLKMDLLTTYPAFEKLTSLSFAVQEEYQKDDFVLSHGDHVVIIPPVSGG